MKLSSMYLPASALLVALLMVVTPKPLLADTYTIFDLGEANANGIYGIDTTGAVVVFRAGACPADECFTTYVNGLAESHSTSAPDLVYDNGEPCSSTPAGFHATRSVCNHGFVGLGTLFNPNNSPNGTYAGSGNDFQFLHGGSADQVFLNSIGDFAWTDGAGEELFEAIDNSIATTPEPGSILLVGTGLLAFTAVVRRRFAR